MGCGGQSKVSNSNDQNSQKAQSQSQSQAVTENQSEQRRGSKKIKLIKNQQKVSEIVLKIQQEAKIGNEFNLRDLRHQLKKKKLDNVQGGYFIIQGLMISIGTLFKNRGVNEENHYAELKLLSKKCGYFIQSFLSKQNKEVQQPRMQNQNNQEQVENKNPNISANQRGCLSFIFKKQVKQKNFISSEDKESFQRNIDFISGIQQKDQDQPFDYGFYLEMSLIQSILTCSKDEKEIQYIDLFKQTIQLASDI